MAYLSAYYDDIVSWAEMYNTASLEAKKVIGELPHQVSGGLYEL